MLKRRYPHPPKLNDPTDATTTTAFLRLPREIRQKILILTIDDEQLLPEAALKIIHHGQEELWADSVEVAVPGWASKDKGAFIVPSSKPNWISNLEVLNRTVREDMKWVRKEWAERVRKLGEIKEEFWEEAFGETFLARALKFNAPRELPFLYKKEPLDGHHVLVSRHGLFRMSCSLGKHAGFRKKDHVTDYSRSA